MNSTINDIVEKIFTCSCGCKTKNIKQHKKSIRHKYMQRKVDLVNAVQIDNNDDIIINDFLIYIPLKKKINKMKVKAIRHIHDISCIIDFD
jgi:hypothetical protein